MVAINDDYGQQQEPEEKHDCSKCRKIPAAIRVIQSSDRRQYQGILNLNEAVFNYRFRLLRNSPNAPIDEVQQNVQFSFTDSEGKELKLQGNVENYMRDLVTGAAVCLAVKLNASGIMPLIGNLEKALGIGNLEQELGTDFHQCQTVTPEIRQYIEDYKARGQKA
jgi:hypothetical protein